VYLDFRIHMHAHVFGVHEEAWDCHGVCHALLHGRSVGRVEDEVDKRGRGVMVECECWVGEGEEERYLIGGSEVGGECEV
jgi:hypothetical protein